MLQTPIANVVLTAENVLDHDFVFLVSIEFYRMARAHFHLSFPLAVLLLVFYRQGKNKYGGGLLNALTNRFLINRLQRPLNLCYIRLLYFLLYIYTR